jgi:Ca2+-binding EF-hand superfamily protein
MDQGEMTEMDRINRDAMGKLGHIIATTPDATLEEALGGTKAGGSTASGKTEDAPASKAQKGDAKETQDKKKGKASMTATKVGNKLKSKVEKVFELLDASNDGFLETDEFVKGVAKIPGVLGITLANGGVESDAHLKFLAKSLDKGGKISILEFLGAFSYEDNDGIADALAEHMVSVLFRFRHALAAGIRYFDEQGLGVATKEEVLLAMQALSAEIEVLGLHFSSSQMEDLVDSLATEKDGTTMIGYEDFLNSFEVMDSQNLATAVKAGN